MKASVTESLCCYELELYKPWFDEECSELLVQKNHVKLQWFQNPSQTSDNNLNNVRCEINTTFRNKKKKKRKICFVMLHRMTEKSHKSVRKVIITGLKLHQRIRNTDILIHM